MILKTLLPILYLDANGDGGAGAGSGAAGTQSGQGSTPAGQGSSQTEGSSGGQSGQQQGSSASQELSLRLQLASHLEEGDRDAWSNWSGRYTDDQAFIRGVNDLRKNAARHQPLPDDKASPEVRHNFFKALGKPDKAEEYALKDDGYGDAEKALLGEFKTFAHTQHLTQAQAEAAKNWHDAQMKASIDQRVAQVKTARAENEKALKQLWGADYETNLSLASEAAGFFFKSADDLAAWDKFRNEQAGADGTVYGNHPMVLRMLAQMGRLLAEDQTLGALNNPGAAASVDAEIKAIEQEALEKGKSTAAEPYHSKLQALYDKKYGKKPLNLRYGQ